MRTAARPTTPTCPHPADAVADGEHGRAGTSAGQASTLAAFAANLGIAVAKLVAWVVTGSASMLAEAIHSVADTSNQGLLLLGRRRARRAPNGRHPFGHGRERYFWSFVVALVLFSGGALFALVEGEEKLRRPHEISSYWWSVGVLAIAFIAEGTSLRTAAKESRRRKREGETWRTFVRRTSVPELAVILLEDSGALIGLVLAFAGTTLAEVTGSSRFDALGSIGIGLLLAAIAFTLAVEIQSMLIGEAADERDVAAIHDALASHGAVSAVTDLRTELLGPDDVLVVGTVSVSPEATDVEQVARELERAAQARVPSARLVYLRTVTERSPEADVDGTGPRRSSRWDRWRAR